MARGAGSEYGLAGLLDKCLPAYARFLTHYALGMICVMTVVFALLLSNLITNPIVLSTGNGFSVRGGVESDNQQALEAGFRVTDYDTRNSITKDTVFERQSQSNDGITLLFEDESDEANVFTEEKLEFMRSFEQKIIEFVGVRTTDDGTEIEESWDVYCLKSNYTAGCNTPLSVIDFFYTDRFDKSTLQDIPTVLNMLASTPSLQSLVTALISAEFSSDNLKAKVVLSSFSMGLPLEGFNNHLFEVDEQDALRRAWGRDIWVFLDTNYRDDSNPVRPLYAGGFMIEYETNFLILSSVALAALAVLFVFVYMWFHTRSAFLTSFAIVHIMMSFPGAYFIYSNVIGIKGFEFVNFLALFVVLGIGADDVFILLDAWKQSASEPDLVASVEKRVAYTMRRSILAMSVSSFTTAAAFYANMISTIPSIQFFGIFAGSLVVINFILVITWFPAFVVLNIRRQRYGLLSFCSGRKAAKQRARARNEGQTDKHTSVNELRAMERFFRDKYSVFIFTYRIHILAFFFVLLIVSIVGASYIRPATDTSQFLDDDTNLQRFISHLADSFASAAFAARIFVTSGIEPRGYDISGIDPLDTTQLGVVVWDDDFDLSDPQTQLFFQETCNELRQVSVIRNEPDDVYCFMDELEHYVTNVTQSTFPVNATDWFDTVVNFTSWRQLQGGQDGGGFGVASDFSGGVRFDNPSFVESGDSVQLRFVNIIANSTFDFTDPASITRPAFQEMNEFVEQRNKAAKQAGLPIGKTFHTTGKWVSMATEEALVTVAVIGVLVSLGVVALVILVSTGSLIVAACATLCVAGTSVTFIAFMVSLGWELGIIESINMTISVGLAVDYIVHFANAYTESHLVATDKHIATGALVPLVTMTMPQANRFLRLRQAMTEMGISVFSSFITTVFSALFLVFTQVIFFQRFGVFIMCVISLSGLYAFFAFFAMMAAVGPAYSGGSAGATVDPEKGG